ncbi:MAG: DUF5666 domain-containing protein [Acidobacteriota bacterium]
MSRKLALALVTLLLAFSIFAKDRAVLSGRDNDARLAGGASVTGEVATVEGNLIRLAGGLVTIDASGARILRGDGPATLADVKPGALIAATLQEPVAGSSGPLVATNVAILRNADVTLTGTTQSVDVAGKQFVLLNRTIKVDANTTFVNFGDRASMSGLQANTLVIVEANAVSGALVASRITLIAPIPPRPQIANGVVKSIGTDAWVITVHDTDTTFVVNASTRILGSPRSGDRVDVLYSVDTANAKVALSIIKSIEPPKIITFTGVVKSVEGSRWVITRDDDHHDLVLTTPAGWRLPPFVRVGDRVAVVATQNPDGTYTLLTIMPRP